MLAGKRGTARFEQQSQLEENAISNRHRHPTFIPPLMPAARLVIVSAPSLFFAHAKRHQRIHRPTCLASKRTRCHRSPVEGDHSRTRSINAADVTSTGASDNSLLSAREANLQRGDEGEDGRVAAGPVGREERNIGTRGCQDHRTQDGEAEHQSRSQGADDRRGEEAVGEKVGVSGSPVPAQFRTARPCGQTRRCWLRYSWRLLALLPVGSAPGQGARQDRPTRETAR